VLPDREALSSDVLELLNANCSMNSKAFLVEKPDSPVIEFVGNRTECALLVMLKKLGFDYSATREARGADQIKVRPAPYGGVCAAWRCYWVCARHIIWSECPSHLSAAVRLFFVPQDGVRPAQA
jgi:hypothetical protein